MHMLHMLLCTAAADVMARSAQTGLTFLGRALPLVCAAAPHSVLSAGPRLRLRAAEAGHKAPPSATAWGCPSPRATSA